MNITAEGLSKVALFRNMSSDEVKDLLSRLNIFTRHVQKNDYVYLAGDVIENICILVSGSLQIIREDAEGDKSIVGSINAGGTFGENHFADWYKKSTLSYLATSPCDLMFIPFRKLTAGIIGNINLYCKFLTNMVTVMACRNNELLEKVDILGKKTLRGKIIAYLQQQAAVNNSLKFVISFNRTDMANYLDADRSAMTRELTKMKKDGLIDFNKHEFSLTKKQK